jgi:hypothetical protein
MEILTGSFQKGKNPKGVSMTAVIASGTTGRDVGARGPVIPAGHKF